MLLTHAVTACGVVDFGVEVFKYLLDMSGSNADSPVSFLFLEGVSLCFVGVIGMTFLGVSLCVCYASKVDVGVYFIVLHSCLTGW